MFRYYKKINAIGEEEARKFKIKYTRSTIKKREKCCRKAIEHDAEKYYKNKIIYIAEVIKDERQ